MDSMRFNSLPAPDSSTANREIHGIGYIEPLSELRQLVPRTGGVIRRCVASLAQRVRSGDVILELEYAINDGGNSGVFIHSALEKNPAFTGHEMQILADYGKEPKKFTTGSLYDVVAPAKNMSKPHGE